MSGKAARLQMIQSSIEAAAAREEAARYQEEQRLIQQQAMALQEEQMRFQQEQAEYIRQQQEEANKLASRPPPATPAGPAVIVTGGSGDGQSAVDSRKKGRAALRIDLNAPQTAGSTGLNVPRG